MKTINDLRYSKQLGEMANYVFIDGVCVKSRSGYENKPTIEEALATNESVLIQEGCDVKIYVNNDELNRYVQWVEFLKKKCNEKPNSMYNPLIEAFNNKKILVITEDYKDGYDFA